MSNLSKPLMFAAVMASGLWPTSHRATSAEQTKVLSAVGMRQVLVELVPMFERATGHRVHLAYDSGAMILRRLEAGEAADVVFLPRDAAVQLAAVGKVIGDSITDVARSRVGVAVRTGAPRPDIASAAALRQTLLAARTVARPDPAMGGSSGLHIQKTFERLGIADAIAAKSILSSHPDREDEMPAARVARGEAEIALHQIQELLAVPGVSVIGPLPGELDGQFVFSAALVSGTRQADAAKKLIAFLVTPQAKAVMNRKGMQAGLQRRETLTLPVVSAADAPAGTEKMAVQWLRISVPDLGVMLAAVARPSGQGPFPVVVVLHGTHGFAQEYVRWAQDLAGGGFLAVAPCWFSGGSGNGSHAVTPPIPCPQLPALKRDAYPEAVQYIDAVLTAARALPGARADRVGIVGHSRGGGETLQYLLAIGNVQAAVLHSAGHGYRPVMRAAEFNLPMLILHGTADGPADGGGVNTQVALARDFEAALRRNQKPVEARYYEGGGHNTFFTNSTQRDDELKMMIAFLRRHLGR